MPSTIANKLSFTIANSPHTHIDVPIDKSLTVESLCKSVLTNYNIEQQSIISNLNLIEMKFGDMFSIDKSINITQLKKTVIPPKTNLHKFVHDNKIWHLNLICTNGNIYKRLNHILKKTNEVLGYGYARFRYHLMTHNEQLKLLYDKEIGELATFTILNKNTDGSINIKLDTPRQLNWGRGPPIPSAYFRLTNDNKTYVYYEGNFFFDDLAKKYNLVRPIDILANEITSHTYACTWSSDELTDECAICLENVANVYFDPCKHINCCETCVKNMEKKECPICRTPIKNFYTSLQF